MEKIQWNCSRMFPAKPVSGILQEVKWIVKKTVITTIQIQPKPFHSHNLNWTISKESTGVLRSWLKHFCWLRLYPFHSIDLWKRSLYLDSNKKMTWWFPVMFLDLWHVSKSNLLLTGDFLLTLQKNHQCTSSTKWQ